VRWPGRDLRLTLVRTGRTAMIYSNGRMGTTDQRNALGTGCDLPKDERSCRPEPAMTFDPYEDQSSDDASHTANIDSRTWVTS
jgi:hypothetical protein